MLQNKRDKNSVNEKSAEKNNISHVIVVVSSLHSHDTFFRLPESSPIHHASNNSLLKATLSLSESFSLTGLLSNIPVRNDTNLASGAFSG
jgi:hypothetical protein